MNGTKRCVWMAAAAVALSLQLHAQDKAPQDNDADAKIVGSEASKPKAETQSDAWTLLEDALHDEKRPQIRIQGMAALGTMGANPRVAKLITEGFSDKELDVRTAAILAAAQTRNRGLLPGVRKLLNDPEPQVAFTAATTLWQMGDHSGQDLLTAVVAGDRKANPSLMHGSMHQANRELHDPAALTKLGVMEGASMLLGPFGFGITAYEYIKKNGGDSARVKAIEDISQVHSEDVHKDLLDALTDKDVAVRAAAAKAVRSYHDDATQRALANLFMDSKRPVQLAAAAGYLISSGAVATPIARPPDRL